MAADMTDRHRTVFATSRAEVHQQMAAAAAPPGLDVIMLENPTRDRLLAEVIEAEFLISERSGVIDASIINTAPSLRLIQRLGSRCHDIDLAAAASAGVAVCRWPLPQPAMVAEHVVLQILALARRLRANGQIVIDGGDFGPPQESGANAFSINWSHQTGMPGLMELTVGIIGLGEIGGEVVSRLRPFGPQIIYTNLHRLPLAVESDLGIRYAPMPDLLASAHVVVLLVPTTPETTGMTDSRFLARMRPGALLVNSGASTTLDETAVADAYRSGHLGGVATDGYRWEPVPRDNPLVALAADPAANVVLTPHTALGDLRGSIELRRADYTNILNLLEGRPLVHRVV